MDEQKNNNENGLIQLSHQELELLQKSLTELNENLKKLVELHPDIDYNHQLSLLKKLYDLLKNCLCK